MKNIDAHLPSNRKFGLFFSLIFALACAYFVSKDNLIYYWIFGGLSLLTFLTTLTSPDLLLPFNKLWFKLGLLLGKIISPIVLGLIYFLLITPVAVLMRMAGRDELRLKLKDDVTHWKIRDPVGPQPESFKNQF